MRCCLAPGPEADRVVGRRAAFVADMPPLRHGPAVQVAGLRFVVLEQLRVVVLGQLHIDEGVRCFHRELERGHQVGLVAVLAGQQVVVSGLVEQKCEVAIAVRDRLVDHGVGVHVDDRDHGVGHDVVLVVDDAGHDVAVVDAAVV